MEVNVELAVVDPLVNPVTVSVDDAEEVTDDDTVLLRVEVPLELAVDVCVVVGEVTMQLVKESGCRTELKAALSSVSTVEQFAFPPE